MATIGALTDIGLKRHKNVANTEASKGTVGGGRWVVTFIGK